MTDLASAAPSSATPSSAAPSSAAPGEPRLEGMLNLQRKAALAAGGAIDHAGRVRVAAMDDFDMSRTIFGQLEGTLPRTLMRDKLAKDVFWSDAAIAEIEAAYAASEAERPTPAVDAGLIQFMEDECDFSMEHADGTFLEHLTFCHDYAVKYFPEHSANVALLHSILGTATNTFAMDIEKLPALKERLTEFEALQVEVFPSMLRLFYDQALLEELEANRHRLDELQALHCHRVIDNAPLVIDADNFWIQLNFHLMHFVDFMPAANWGARRSDPLLQQFRTLSDFLDRAGKRQAKVDVTFPAGPRAPVGETPSLVGRLSARLPGSLTLALARKSIRKYSGLIGHSLDYRLEWR
ncbi:MAG: hypothetical protein AAF447_11690 [Myxococcota bacterium]